MMVAWCITVCTSIAYTSSFCQALVTINNKTCSTVRHGPPSHLTAVLEPTAPVNPPRTPGQAQALGNPSEGELHRPGDFTRTDN